MAVPLPCCWDGESFAPLPGFARRADQEYVIGEVYTLAPVEARSEASHRHYFAAVHEGWTNLPEDKLEDFPTSEHLRKKALIKAGYRDEQSITCASRAEALRVAAFIRGVDDYAIVIVSGSTVTRYTAKSQNLKAMNREAFEASKAAVLDLVSTLIGVEPEQLSSAAKDRGAGRSAPRLAAA
jgi:hypothetical protein